MSAGGWCFPTFAARKAHYFPGPNTRSYCGKYHHVPPIAGALQSDADGKSVDDCATCRRKRDAQGATP